MTYTHLLLLSFLATAILSQSQFNGNCIGCVQAGFTYDSGACSGTAGKGNPNSCNQENDFYGVYYYTLLADGNLTLGCNGQKACSYLTTYNATSYSIAIEPQ